MSFIDFVYEQVRQQPKRVVFPEGGDPKILQAAAQFRDLGLGAPILIGNVRKIQDLAQQLRLSLDHISLLDPLKSTDMGLFIERLERIGHYRNIDRAAARSMLEKPGYYAAMMTSFGHSDVVIGGSSQSSSKLLRPLMQLIPFLPQVKFVSACTLYIANDHCYGESGVIFMADTGVIPSPNVEQLAAIAIKAGTLFRQLTEKRPRIAMLSFSTKATTPSPLVGKVVAATALAKRRIADESLEMDLDGELQADVAIMSSIAQNKAAGSLVAGNANVLVFPDLQSASIASRLLRCLGDGASFGRLILGLSIPAGELFQSASVDEIVGTSALLSLQAIQYHELYQRSRKT